MLFRKGSLSQSFTKRRHQEHPEILRRYMKNIWSSTKIQSCCTRWRLITLDLQIRVKL